MKSYSNFDKYFHTAISYVKILSVLDPYFNTIVGAGAGAGAGAGVVLELI